MRTSSRRHWLLGIGIVVLTGLAVALTLVEQRTQREVADSAAWVAHTREVAREFQVTRTLLDEAETGQRGYLLTEREAYLQPYEQKRTEVDGHLTQLRALTADNPSQQVRLARLEPLVTSRLAVLARTIAAARAHHREDAIQIIQTDNGQQLMDAIRATVAAGIQEEDQLLDAREARFTTSVRRRSLLIVALSVLVVLTVAIVFWLVLRLERVRALVTLCSWSRSVEYEGAWITFEQYLARRFNLRVTLGMSPSEAARFVEEHGDPRDPPRVANGA